MIHQARLAALAALALAGCNAAGASGTEQADAGVGVVPRAEQPAKCPSEGAALQVLGSGGPIAETDRAGTSYLLWVDGKPSLLIDAGAGSFLRFAQAGGKLAHLDAILLTHLHADHAGDLAGILNSGGFEGRTKPLPIIGPADAPRFPATSEFLDRLMSKENGAFAYNGGYLDGTENKFKLEPRDVEVRMEDFEPSPVLSATGYQVTAIPVDHGFAPALGYEIRLGEKSIVITGDQNAQSLVFLETLRGAKPAILFAHHVISEKEGQPRGLHRSPEEIGELAGALEPERMVLTHNMKRSLDDLDNGLAAVAKNYSGPVSVAQDLDCYAL